MWEDVLPEECAVRPAMLEENGWLLGIEGGGVGSVVTVRQLSACCEGLLGKAVHDRRELRLAS